MRRADPYLLLAGVLAVASGCATFFGAPVAIRAAVGLPLVTLLPGYALSVVVFGQRLKAPERLLLSLAFSLAADIVGGVFLSFSPWGLHPRPWAVLLASLTLAFSVAGQAATKRSPRRARAPRGTIAFLPVLAICIAVTSVAIAADRRPTTPPRWLTGYTLLWLLPERSGYLRVGLQSGELERERYRVEIRSQGRVVARWITGTIEPSKEWQRTFRRINAGRVDAFLYRVGDPAQYRHAYIHGSTAS
jgi:hypothetical protein